MVINGKVNVASIDGKQENSRRKTFLILCNSELSGIFISFEIHKNDQRRVYYKENQK